MEALKASALAAAKGLIAKGFTVEFRSVKYSRAELEQLASQLFSTMDQWAPGLTGAAGGWDPEENRVVILVPEDKAQASAARVQALNDDRVTLQTFTPAPGPRTENRTHDFSPWAAGAWLSDDPALAATIYNNDCTAGYNWLKWGTNVRYGSSAYHCIGSNYFWYNDQQLFGYSGPGYGFTSPAADTFLMNWPPSRDYSPFVFVGDQATNTDRLIVGVKNSWQQGDVVALSGASTGLHSAKVRIPNFYDADYNRTVVLMDQHISAGGDSGAPWLTTRSQDGFVIAHGQHFGYGPPGYDGSEFIPVNYISSKLSASLLTGYNY